MKYNIIWFIIEKVNTEETTAHIKTDSTPGSGNKDQTNVADVESTDHHTSNDNNSASIEGQTSGKSVKIITN